MPGLILVSMLLALLLAESALRRYVGIWTLVLVGILAAVGSASGQPVAVPIAVQVEKVADNQWAGVIHGWHANRLLIASGRLYAIGLLPAPETAQEERFHTPGVFYRRESDGSWTAVESGLPHLYSFLVDPEGFFWGVSNTGYDNITVSRSIAPLDPSRFETRHTGLNFYSGVGMSPEGNVLAIYAETQNFDIYKPNALITAFFDRKTGQWHQSRIETPEGRYGYVGIVLRGRRAFAVLNSALRDPEANPVPPHYTWRHVRLAYCDDLRRGRWVVRAWLMPRYGSTTLQDLIVGPDGNAYLAYSHVGGNTLAEVAGKPALHYVARITMDRRLKTTVYPTQLLVPASRLFVSTRGGWYLVGRPRGSTTLWLYTLDPSNGYLVKERRELTGTDLLQGYVIYTLRPERFGGQADGDRVHLLSAEQIPAHDEQPERAVLWHAAFDLPESGARSPGSRPQSGLSSVRAREKASRRAPRAGDLRGVVYHRPRQSDGQSR